MGARERSGAFTSWCCGWDEQSQLAVRPHTGGPEQECKAPSLLGPPPPASWNPGIERLSSPLYVRGLCGLLAQSRAPPTRLGACDSRWEACF